MKSKFAKYLLVGFLACLGLSVLILLFGHVAGEEFSAQSFKVRKFSYYQLPIAKYQLTPVTTSKSSRGNAPLATCLKSNKLLGKRSSVIRWDIVYLGDVSSADNVGDAEILLKYLEQPGAFGTESWHQWTLNKKNREIVTLFWPLIGKLAEEQLYILMPDVFDWARAASSAAEFTAHVRADLPSAIQRLADAERQRKNTSRAEELDQIVLDVRGLQPVAISDSMYDESPHAQNSSAGTSSTSKQTLTAAEIADGIDAEADPEELDAE